MTLRILFDIGHPAHLHLLKNVAWKIEELGGKVCITTRDKDVAIDLLDAYGFEYHIVGRYRGLVDKLLSIVRTNYRLLKIAKEFNPHVFLSAGSVHAPPVARILNRISMAFVDTEGSVFQGCFFQPIVTRIYTPAVFKRSLGGKHIRYNGYHEMAYLLPKYFKPDPEALSKYGLKREDTYFIVRIVSWGATHDWGQKGIGDLPRLVQHLEKYGKVVLSVEAEMESDYSDYTLTTSPEDMHSMLAYARAYVGEGATMASESASLGTPSIYLNTQTLSYINEQMAAGLVYHIIPSQNMGTQILTTIDKIMTIPPEHFREKCRSYITGKIDVVEFILKELFDLARMKYLQ